MISKRLDPVAKQRILTETCGHGHNPNDGSQTRMRRSETPSCDDRRKRAIGEASASDKLCMDRERGQICDAYRLVPESWMSHNAGSADRSHDKGSEEKLTRPYATAKQTIPANEVE